MVRRIVPLLVLCVLFVPAAPATAAAPKVGDKVWAQWRPNAWYHGTVDKAVPVGFHIAFDDGDRADLPVSLLAADAAPAKADAKVGLRVLAKWTDGKLYPALIVKEADGNYDVHFDDGAKSTVPLDDLRLMATTVTAARTPKAGDKVWAQWRPNAWYHGTVDRAGTAGLHINFDDGDKGEIAVSLVTLDNAPKKKGVKSGTRVLAKWTDGKFYPATVTTAGDTFQVQFDDGAKGEVDLDGLRVLNQ